LLELPGWIVRYKPHPATEPANRQLPDQTAQLSCHDVRAGRLKARRSAHFASFSPGKRLGIVHGKSREFHFQRGLVVFGRRQKRSVFELQPGGCSILQRVTKARFFLGLTTSSQEWMGRSLKNDRQISQDENKPKNRSNPLNPYSFSRR
jgi:hypothetical protein